MQLTWRSKEKGKQDLNVSLLSILFMNNSHEVVMLSLKPLSNTCGRGVDPVSSAAAILAVDEELVDVDVDVVVPDVVVLVDCLIVEDLTGSSPPTCLFFRSAATVARIQSCACACGGGERSTKSGPD